MSERYKRYSFSWWWLGVVLALFASHPSLAQPSTGSVLSPSLTVGRSTCGAMPDPAARVYGLWIATDAATTSACGAGGGANYVLYMDTGNSWVARVAGNSDVACADVTDSTAAGCALLTALTAALQRTALGLGTSATLNVPASGDAASGEVVKGNDSRLTDARAPTTHVATHKHGGTDEVATATPAANAIPKAGSGGTIAAGWVPTLNQDTTGNAATADFAATATIASEATALSTNGANCAAGNYPLGVDASGAVESCTADNTGTDDQTAAEVSYSNTTSGLTATDVQAAIDEVAAAGGGGSGDVVGPASATDECLARFDTTTGKLLQNSVICATDAGVVTGPTQLNVDNLRLDGNTVSATTGDISLAGSGGISWSFNGASRGDLSTSTHVELGLHRGASDNYNTISFYTGPSTRNYYLRVEPDGIFYLRTEAGNGLRIDTSGNVTFDKAVMLSDPGTQPTCDSTQRGKVWNDQGGAGVADQLSVCCKKADDTYVWATTLGACS